MSKCPDRSYEQSLRDREGEAGEVMRNVYGKDEAEFEKIIEYERRRRAGIFNRKLNRKP